MTDRPTPPLPDGLALRDWRAELAAGGALTPAQLQALQQDPAVPESLRVLIEQALAGHAAANWMLGLALNYGAVQLKPRAEG